MKVGVRLWTPILLVTLTAAFVACGGGNGSPSTISESPAFGLISTVVAPSDHVSQIAFAPDGRIFFAEQFTGNIRIIGTDGKPQANPFATLDVANWGNIDWGLTGLALDPEFSTNHYAYAFYTSFVDRTLPSGKPVVVRFTDDNGLGTNETTISDNFPVTYPDHQGYKANGKMHFGPDGFLYVSLGDYDCATGAPGRDHCIDMAFATANGVQNLSNPVGKLLRINKADGTAAPGNPDLGPGSDPRIFAYGFGEPFDFAFYKDKIYGTDNTTVSCEELNLIQAGKNYGWPVGTFPFGDCSAGGQPQAIYYFAREGKQPSGFLSFVQVSSLAPLSGAKYQLPTGDSLLVCESERAKETVDSPELPGALVRIGLSSPKLDSVTANDIIVRDCKGAVAVSPDGTIYYANDTEIRKLENKPQGSAALSTTATPSASSH